MSKGQSLSCGVGTEEVRLTEQPHDSLMFVGGVRAQDGGSTPWVSHASLVPLVEEVGPTMPGGDRYETPLSGMALMLKQLGSPSRLLASAPGQGATNIATLSAGPLFERAVDDVRYGRARAKAMGRSYKLRSSIWMQGEADGSNNAYAAALNAERTSFSDAVRAITGQPEDVWYFVSQLDRAKIGLAQLEASDIYDYIRLAFPQYFLPRSDGVHLTAAGSDIAGAYAGLAHWNVVDQGNSAWQPLRALGAEISGAVLDITYDPVGSLVFDTLTVPAQTNQGYRLFDASNNALTLISAAIVAPEVVRLTANTTIEPEPIWRYGFSDPTDHTANVSKGNLRDSQGDEIVFDGQGLNYPMHNWSLIEQGSTG